MVAVQDTATTTIKRIHSRDPEHLREDLAAALKVARAPELSRTTPADRHLADAIIADLADTGAQGALRQVARQLGARILGIVMLFSMEAETSLSGDAEVMSTQDALASMGLELVDLGWPEEVLHPRYQGQGRAWTTREQAAFNAAVAAYREAHLDRQLRTYTVIGHWIDGPYGPQVVIAGIVDGHHQVWGSAYRHDDTAFVDVLTIDATAPDPDAELRAAIAAKHYDRRDDGGLVED